MPDLINKYSVKGSVGGGEVDYPSINFHEVVDRCDLTEDEEIRLRRLQTGEELKINADDIDVAIKKVY